MPALTARAIGPDGGGERCCTSHAVVKIRNRDIAKPFHQTGICTCGMRVDSATNGYHENSPFSSKQFTIALNKYKAIYMPYPYKKIQPISTEKRQKSAGTVASCNGDCLYQNPVVSATKLRGEYPAAAQQLYGCLPSDPMPFESDWIPLPPG